jgi:hypothetical protein
MFPMCAEVFYPIVDQDGYGTIKKTWILDRSVSCSFSSAGSAFKEEVVPNKAITQDVLLIGRVKNDIRLSDRNEKNSIVNVVVTNIKDGNGNHIYTETAGPRAGKSTIFEIAAQEPYAGPFGNVEFYKVVLRRSENQAVDV